MTEVKIYDFDFSLIASDFKCVSFEWDIRYNSIGNFEGVFTADSPIYDACRQKDFTVCVQGENQGIVTKVTIKEDRVVISGKTMNYILEKRFCMPFSTHNEGEKMTETEMVYKIVEQNCGDFMEVLQSPMVGEAQHFTRTKPRSVFAMVSEILSGINGGHYVKFDVDNKKWVFGCIFANYTSLVLSRPDNTLDNCDYVKNIRNFASCGIYSQQLKLMGEWDAERNLPFLSDYNPENFAVAYRISSSGEQFNKYFEKGKYLVCKNESGMLEQSNNFSHFWYKKPVRDERGPYAWEGIVDCEDISEVDEKVLLREIEENVVAITRGVKQEDLKIGDVVEIRLTSGDSGAVFKKQVKRVHYHYQWGNVFVRPTFYKLKENEDEQL